MKTISAVFTRHRHAAGAAVSFVLLIGFMLSTKPSEDSFALSFVPLLFLWVCTYFCVGFILGALPRQLEVVRVRLLRITVASTAVLLVMFSALGQLTLADAAVLLALVALGSFYFSRTWR